MRYEKGRKDASRAHILDVAAERFRRDGIAASGLAGIMQDAGLTNGAFYPHFRSKADLIGDSVAAAMERQLEQVQAAIAAGGLDKAIDLYLSAGHRDHPETGCASAALLPEIARAAPELRSLYTGHFKAFLGVLASGLPQAINDPESTALAIFGAMVGTLQIARAIDDPVQSERALQAGADAARAMIRHGSAVKA